MLGIDMLGGPSYTPAAVQAYKTLNSNFAVGVFWNWKVFGQASNFINQLYGAGCRTFRIHIMWDPSHAYGPQQQVDVLDEYKRCAALISAKASAKFYVSLFCEHHHPAAVMRPLLAKARKISAFPTLVNSIEPGGAILPEEINEVHGLNSRKPGPKYIVSPDGNSLNRAGAVAFNRAYSDALIRFAWDSTLNLHSNDQKTSSIVPTAQHIIDLGKLLLLS